MGQELLEWGIRGGLSSERFLKAASLWKKGKIESSLQSPGGRQAQAACRCRVGVAG